MSPTLQLGDETIHTLELLATIFPTNLKPNTAIIPTQQRANLVKILQEPPIVPKSIPTRKKSTPTPLKKSSLVENLIPETIMEITPPPNLPQKNLPYIIPPYTIT